MIPVRVRYKNDEGYYTEDNLCEIKISDIPILIQIIDACGVQTSSGRKPIVDSFFELRGTTKSCFLIIAKSEDEVNNE